MPKPKPDVEDAPETVEIVWRDTTFTLPKDMDDWDTDACIALSDAARSSQLKDLKQAIRLALGEAQWAALQALGSSRGALKAFAVEFGRVVDEDCV